MGPKYSPAKFDQFENNGNWIKYHYSGGNNAAPAPAFTVPDIDVKIELEFKKISSSKFQVGGSVKGDRFPSNETYLTDKNGNKLFLGVSGPDAMFNEALGPYTELFFAGEERMQNFNLFIMFNDDETFKGVSLGNGKWYELSEWNKNFTSLSPGDQNVGTNVVHDKIEVDYDPD